MSFAHDPFSLHDYVMVLPDLLDLRINNTSLHFPVTFIRYGKAKFCVRIISQTFSCFPPIACRHNETRSVLCISKTE